MREKNINEIVLDLMSIINRALMQRVLGNRLTRLEVLKVIKKHRLGISPSKLIKRYNNSNEIHHDVFGWEIYRYDDIKNTITELKRDSSITKLLNNE